LAALMVALLAAAPPAGRAEETGAEAEVSVPAREELSAPATTLPPDATAEPWWRPSVDGPWRFAVVIWGWLPEAPADITLGPAEADLPESLDTILDSVQWGAFLDLEARKGPFGAYATPIVLGLRDSFHVTGPLGVRRRVAISEKAVLMDFGVSYELGRWQLGTEADSPAVTVEPFVGGRWLFDDLTLDVDPGRRRSVDVDFAAPVIGLRTFWDLTERWNLRLGGDYGGFDVDDVDETYNLAGTVGYRFMLGGVRSNVFAGYRYLYIDYQKSANELEVTLKGPILGIGFEF
jgi:hypothetical protein